MSKLMIIFIATGTVNNLFLRTVEVLEPFLIWQRAMRCANHLYRKQTLYLQILRPFLFQEELFHQQIKSETNGRHATC